MNWAKAEINGMTQNSRVAILTWFWVIVAGWAIATFLQAIYGHYEDAAAEIVVFGYIFLLKWVWPLWVARSVRIRGGKFSTWYTVAIIFGLIISGLFYLVRWSNRPTLQSESSS